MDHKVLQYRDDDFLVLDLTLGFEIDLNRKCKTKVELSDLH